MQEGLESSGLFTSPRRDLLQGISFPYGKCAEYSCSQGPWGMAIASQRPGQVRRRNGRTGGQSRAHQLPFAWRGMEGLCAALLKLHPLNDVFLCCVVADLLPDI